MKGRRVIGKEEGEKEEKSVQTVRNSTKTEKELVLKEGLVLLLGTVLRQRRISTMRGVELWEKGQVSEMEREREKERMMIRKIYVLCEGNIH